MERLTGPSRSRARIAGLCYLLTFATGATAQAFIPGDLSGDRVAILARMLLGILIFKSTYLLRVIGVLMGLAGLALRTFLATPIGELLSAYNMAVDILGEAALTVRLVLMGVNVQRCEAKTRLEWSSGGAEFREHLEESFQRTHPALSEAS